MLRIVLPTVATGGPVCCSIEILITANVGVAVPHEVVVVIDVDIIIASPSAVVAPATTPSRAHGHSDAEGNGGPSSVIPRWRISDRRVRINRRAIHDGRVITGNIDDFWIGLLDDNHLLALDYFCFYLLLFRGL